MRNITTLLIIALMSGCSSSKPRDLTVSRLDNKPASEAAFTKDFYTCRGKYKKRDKVNACIRNKGWKVNFPKSTINSFVAGMAPAFSSIQLPTSSHAYQPPVYQQPDTSFEDNQRAYQQQHQIDEMQRQINEQRRAACLNKPIPKGYIRGLCR